MNSPFHSGIASHLSGEAMSLLIEQPESLRNSLAAARRLAVISRWYVSEHTTPKLKAETRRTSIKIPSRSAEFAAALVSSHRSYSLPSTQQTTVPASAFFLKKSLRTSSGRIPPQRSSVLQSQNQVHNIRKHRPNITARSSPKACFCRDE